jgi:hypothetical protein
MNEREEDKLVSAVKQAAWKDMEVLRQRRYDNLPKIDMDKNGSSHN